MPPTLASAAPAVDIASLARHIGQIVTLRGWVYHLRSSGKVRFLVVRDGTGLAQGVLVKGNLPEEDFQQFERLTLESSLMLEGMVRAEPRAPGGYELEVTRVLPVQIAPEYPISPKEHGVAFLMDRRHLWLRSPRQQAILRIRDEVCRACRDFFHERGFVLVDTPILTPTGLRRHHQPLRDRLPGPGQGLSLPERPALSGGRGHGPGPGLLLRPHLPGRKIQDPAPPDGVLDGGGRGRLLYPGRRHGTGGRPWCASWSLRVLEHQEAQLRLLERDIAPLTEEVAGPFPRLSYTEALERLAGGRAKTWPGARIWAAMRRR